MMSGVIFVCGVMVGMALYHFVVLFGSSEEGDE